MNDHDLMHNTIERLAQMDKWTKVLGGQLRNDGDWVIGGDCCTYGECVGGYGCPVREKPVEQLVWPALDLPSPKYCERTKQHCNTPWTCSSQCRVIDSQLPVQMFEPPRWYHRPPSLYFFAVVWALIGFAVAVYQTFLN